MFDVYVCPLELDPKDVCYQSPTGDAETCPIRKIRDHTNRCTHKKMTFKPRPITEMEKDGYTKDYNHSICQKCETEMLRRVKSYPPYCDSTYEEFECPKCGNSISMSI